MNKQEVFLLSGNDEVFLGTVGEIIGTDRWEANEAGRGMSLAAIISDLVSGIAFDDGPQTFTIELREPGAS